MEFGGQARGQHVIFEGSLAEMLRFWCSKLRFWRKSRRKASFLSFKASFLKEVSQKCFVLELQSFVFEGSLAEMLRFWPSKLHFWRKSRKKVSFLSFTASFLKEVSQKCFVFEHQSFIFEGSLAEKLRFRASKLRFWRKSRRKASFLSIKASFLKEVSQKSFVFELQSFIFEGSLAQKLRFWASKLQFWRKSRTKASFLSIKASFLKEVSQKSFVFMLQSFVFEGSLAEMLRFRASKLRFWRKSRTKASFLSFKAWFLKEVSQKSFVFELHSFNFEGSLAEMLRFRASKLRFWRKSRRNASFLSIKASFLKEVSQKSFVFDLQSFIFEGSLAEKLRFWASQLQFWRKSRKNASLLIFKASFLKEVSQKKLRFWAAKLYFWRKSRRNASFLSIKASFLKEVSQKSFVFELQSFVFEGSLAEMFVFDLQSFIFEGILAEQLQSVSQSISQLVRSVSQSVSQSADSQSVSQSISQSVGQLVTQSVSQLISQWVSQSVSQSVS